MALIFVSAIAYIQFHTKHRPFIHVQKGRSPAPKPTAVLCHSILDENDSSKPKGRNSSSTKAGSIACSTSLTWNLKKTLTLVNGFFVLASGAYEEASCAGAICPLKPVGSSHGEALASSSGDSSEPLRKMSAKPLSANFDFTLCLYVRTVEAPIPSFTEDSGAETPSSMSCRTCASRTVKPHVSMHSASSQDSE